MKKLLMIIPMVMLSLISCGQKTTPLNVPEDPIEEKSELDLIKEHCDNKSLGAITRIENENKKAKLSLTKATSNEETVTITFKTPMAYDEQVSETINYEEEIVYGTEYATQVVKKGTTWANILKPIYRRNDAVYNVIGFSDAFDETTKNGKLDEVEYTYNLIVEQEVAPVFLIDTYYQKVESDYVLLTTQPEDWETNYTSYYTREEKIITKHQLISSARIEDDVEVYAIYGDEIKFICNVSAPSDLASGMTGEHLFRYRSRFDVTYTFSSLSGSEVTTTSSGYFVNNDVLTNFYNLKITNSGKTKRITFLMPCDDFNISLGNSVPIYEGTTQAKYLGVPSLNNPIITKSENTYRDYVDLNFSYRYGVYGPGWGKERYAYGYYCWVTHQTSGNISTSRYDTSKTTDPMFSYFTSGWDAGGNSNGWNTIYGGNHSNRGLEKGSNLAMTDKWMTVASSMLWETGNNYGYYGYYSQEFTNGGTYYSTTTGKKVRVSVWYEDGSWDGNVYTGCSALDIHSYCGMTYKGGTMGNHYAKYDVRVYYYKVEIID